MSDAHAMKVRLLTFTTHLLVSPIVASVATDTIAPSLSKIVAPGGSAPVYDRQFNHFPVLQLTATDNAAGVQYLMATFSPISTSGEFSGENEITIHTLAERALLTGSTLSGTFSMECRIPRGSAAGSYRLRALKIADASGNIADYAADGSAPALPMASPFAFSIEGDDGVVQPSVGDSAPPSLDSVAIAPAQLGVATSAGFFNLSLGVRDDISGIEAAEVWMVSPSGVYLCLTAEGGQAVVAGDERIGILHLRGRIPVGAESGNWRVARVGLRDRTGKTSLAGWEQNGQLAAAGLLVFTTDEDGDGHLENDLFPGDSAEWSDQDQDGIGDNADEDDDNDGLPDSWEITHGMNPLDPADASTDADGDTLSALNEYLTGTRPDSIDSDADGIADGDEGPLHGTNPGNRDSDGDGYLDGTEVVEGFSPAEAGQRPPLKATGAMAADGFNLRFVSRLGYTYRIESTSDFDHWDLVEDGIPGDGQPLLHLLPKVTERSGFYRVVESGPVEP